MKRIKFFLINYYPEKKFNGSSSLSLEIGLPLPLSI